MSDCNVDVSANKIDKKAVRERSNLLMRQGKTKQETFEQLKKEFRHAKIIVKILKCIPSNYRKKKYRWLNHLLLISLLPIFLLLTYYTSWAVSFYILMLYVVARLIARYYLAITAFSFVIMIISTLLFFLEENTNILVILILVFLNLTTLVLSYKLEQKLCPKVMEQKEKYIDKQGLTRVRIIYTFTD